MFDYNYKKEFKEWPEPEDHEHLHISELLALKLKYIEWDFVDGYIRRLKLHLNTGNSFPTFGQHKNTQLQNKFEFPENTRIK